VQQTKAEKEWANTARDWKENKHKSSGHTPAFLYFVTYASY